MIILYVVLLHTISTITAAIAVRNSSSCCEFIGDSRVLIDYNVLFATPSTSLSLSPRICKHETLFPATSQGAEVWDERIEERCHPSHERKCKFKQVVSVLRIHQQEGGDRRVHNK
jgi:hypothetical protein